MRNDNMLLILGLQIRATQAKFTIHQLHLQTVLYEQAVLLLRCRYDSNRQKKQNKKSLHKTSKFFEIAQFFCSW